MVRIPVAIEIVAAAFALAASPDPKFEPLRLGKKPSRVPLDHAPTLIRPKTDMSIHVTHALALAYKACLRYLTSKMARRKKMVTFAIEPELYNRLEAWLARQEFPPTRTTVFETAVKRLLDEIETKEKKERKR